MKYLILFFIFLFKILNAQNGSLFEKEGYYYFKEHRYDKALESFNNAIKVDSLNPRYYDGRACALEKLNMVEFAINDFKKSLKLNPNYIFSYHHLSLLYLNKMMYSDAISIGKLGLSKIPDFDSIKCDLLNVIGLSYNYMKEYDSSISYLKQVNNYCKNNSIFAANLALTYSNKGDKKEAIKILKNVIKYDSTNSNIYNNLGMRHLEIYQYETAIGYFNKSIHYDSSNSFSYNNLGYCLYKTKNYESALKYINMSLEINSNNPYAYKNRGLLFLAIDDLKNACEDFQKAENLNYSKIYDNSVIELLNKLCK